MALRFLIGTAGSGKTYQCIQEIVAKQKTQKGRQILLVPEQFTSQAERDLTMATGQSAILTAEVLSFGRLAYQIFAKSGLRHTNTVDDIGKQMALQKILLSYADNITYFRNMMDKNGFVDQLAMSISEFFQYQITPDMLLQLAQNQNLPNSAQEKCKEMALLYQAYLDFLQSDHLSSDETLSLLAQKLSYTQEAFCDTEIWIDGFYGFTPQEYDVIAQLLCICERVTVTLPMDRNSYFSNSLPPYAPFWEPHFTKCTLDHIAQQTGIAIESPVFFSYNHRVKTETLRFLAENYFYAYYKKSPHTDGLHIISCATRQEEITFAAGKILELVRKNHLRFREIAIVTNALSSYENSLRGILSEYQIPYFIDTRKDISSHPLFTLVRALLDCVVYDFRYEAVCSYLKSGLTPMPQEDIDILENYLLAYGIKGYKWRQENWSYGFQEGQEDEQAYINTLRQQVMEPFAPWQKRKRKKVYPLQELAADLIQQLDTLQIAERLTDLAEQTEQPAKAEEHRQIWQSFVQLLQTAVDILGDTPVTLAEFSKILQAGLEKSSIGIIPPTADCLVIGDIERSRLPEIRVLFVLGVNEGVLPAPAQTQGIFSETERDAIQQNGITLAPDGKRKLFEEQFLIYRGLSKPSEALYMTYANGDIEGKGMFPSALIERICRMFPNLQIQTSDTLPLDMLAPATCFHHLGAFMQDYASDTAAFATYWQDIYSFFATSPQWQERLELLQNGFLPQAYQNRLSPEIAKSLYGNNILSSVSRLERFAACPFAYFAEYGLQAKPRQIYQLHTPDLGILFHQVLESFCTQLEQDNVDWQNLTQEETENRISLAVDVSAPKIGNEILLDSAANRYLVRRLKRISKRAAWALVRHIQSGSFIPKGYEIGFGPQEALPPIIISMADGSKLILRGKIDRVDILDANGVEYVKIIDYKSGNTAFRLQDIYYGLQLQLLLYLDAFLKENPDAKTCPGGAFYFHIADPSISVSSEISEQELEELLYQKMQMSGLVLDDPTVIQAIDHVFVDEKTGQMAGCASSIIPLQYTKAGRPSASSLLASKEEYQKLMDFTAKRAATIGENMKSGTIQPAPYRKGDATPCQYCIFSSICRYDYENQPHYRDLKKIRLEDFWAEHPAELFDPNKTEKE